MRRHNILFVYVSGSQKQCGWAEDESNLQIIPISEESVLPRRQILLLPRPSDLEAFNLKLVRKWTEISVKLI